MTPVPVHFTFAIGDIVQHVLDRAGHADKMLVVSRRYEECEGGGQKSYLTRFGLWNKETAWFGEGELSPWDRGQPRSYNDKAGEDQARYSERAERGVASPESDEGGRGAAS